MGVELRIFENIYLVFTVVLLVFVEGSIPDPEARASEISLSVFQDMNLIPILEQSDYLIVVNNTAQVNNLNSQAYYGIMTGHQNFQIAIVGTNRLKEIRLGKRFDPTVFSIAGQLNDEFDKIKHLKSKSSTWIFHSECFIPNNYRAEITDNLFVVKYHQSRHAWAAQEMYQIKSVRFRLEIHRNQSLSTLNRRQNFNGTALDVGYVDLGTSLVQTQPPNFASTGKEMLHNCCGWATDDVISYQFLAYMQDYLNFSVRFHKASTWVWAPSNATLSMADLLNQRDYDLAVSNTGLWPSADYRFLFLTKVFRELYVYYHPPENSNAKDLTKAIEFDVWLGFILFGVVIFGLGLCVFDGSAADMFSWSVATVTTRGIAQPDSIYSWTAKYFVLICSVTTLLLYVSVSGFLVSSFAIQEELSNLDDLVSRGFKFGFLENSIIHNGFKLGWLSKASPLWEIRSLYKTFGNETPGAAEVVAQKQFAFLTSNSFFVNYPMEMENLPVCGNMKMFTLRGQTRFGSAFVKKNSEFYDYFNLPRILMSQVGITGRFLTETRRQSEDAVPNCLSPADHKSRQVGISIQETWLTFQIFLYGFAFSVLILLVEITRFRFRLWLAWLRVKKASLNKLQNLQG